MKGQQRGRSDNPPSMHKTRVPTQDTPGSRGAHQVSFTCGTTRNRYASPSRVLVSAVVVNRASTSIFARTVSDHTLSNVAQTSLNLVTPT